jgi:hypothetical protein
LRARAEIDYSVRQRFFMRKKLFSRVALLPSPTRQQRDPV